MNPRALLKACLLAGVLLAAQPRAAAAQEACQLRDESTDEPGAWVASSLVDNNIVDLDSRTTLQWVDEAMEQEYACRPSPGTSVADLVAACVQHFEVCEKWVGGRIYMPASRACSGRITSSARQCAGMQPCGALAGLAALYTHATRAAVQGSPQPSYLVEVSISAPCKSVPSGEANTPNLTLQFRLDPKAQA
jgi:hypothetical protein